MNNTAQSVEVVVVVVVNCICNTLTLKVILALGYSLRAHPALALNAAIG